MTFSMISSGSSTYLKFSAFQKQKRKDSHSQAINFSSHHLFDEASEDAEKYSQLDPSASTASRFHSIEMVSSSEYFKGMRAVTKQIAPLMLDAAKSIDSACPELLTIISELVQKRASTKIPKLRPFMVALAAGITEMNDVPPAILQVAALVELLNLATYLENLAFDRKGECKAGDLTSFKLAANILQTAIHEYLSVISEMDALLVNRIHAILSSSYREVAQGQYVDLQKIPSLGSEAACTLSLDSYLDLYIQKCYLFGKGSFGYACIVGGIAGGVNNAQIDKLKTFGKYHGLALQVINDLADFSSITKSAESVGKDTMDRYADLRNQRLTLPIYIAYMLSDPEDQAYLRSYKSDYLFLDDERLFEILRKTQALDYSYSLAKAADQKALDALTGLNGRQFDFLRASLAVSLENGKYRYIRDTMHITLRDVRESTHQLGKLFLNLIEDKFKALPS